MAIKPGDPIQAADFRGFIQMYAGALAPEGWLLCDGAAVSRTTYDGLYALIGDAYGDGDGSTTFNVPDLRSSSPLGLGQKTKSFSFNGATDVDPATDQITVSSNDYLHTGQVITLSGSTLPTGLSAGIYYIIRQSAVTIKLATSVANANAGVAVNITADGSGICTLTLTLTNRSLGDEGGEEKHALSDAEMPSHKHGFEGGFEYSGSPDTNDKPLDTSSSTVSSRYPETTSRGNDYPHNNMSPYVTVNYIIKT